MSFVNELIFEPVDILSSFVRNTCKKTEITHDDIFHIVIFLEEFKNLFKVFSSEALILNTLEGTQFFIKPEQFTVGEYIETKNNIPVVKKCTAQFISLSKVLTNFFFITSCFI